MSPILLTKESSAEDIKRAERAWKVRFAKDVNFPQLKYWNYGPCAYHRVPQVDCEYRQCGGEPFKHQRVGATWLYLQKKGILADVPGAGKTNTIFLLASMLKERGQLQDRAIVVSQAPAVEQWRDEAYRWIPNMKVIAAIGNRSQRIQKYATDWDMLFISYQMLLKDLELMCRLQPGLLVSDDIDPLRTPGTATSKAFNRLSAYANRVVVINATPLQIKLEEMWSTAKPVGGLALFGSQLAFERRYIRSEPVIIFNRNTGRQMTKHTIVGYKNGEEFREKIAPIYLRRNYDDLDDISMPEIAPPETVWLDLHPAQRVKYEELQEGILRLIREKGEELKFATALTKMTYGQEICAGLPALGEPDGPEASVKLDWLENKMTGDWIDEKVVCYIRNTGNIRAINARMERHGIEVAKIWGPDRASRSNQITKFWKDPNCRLAVGTSAMERSLNLQTARICVNLDTLLNPQRMVQILGRVRRAGSKHKTVYVFTLLARDTQEDRYQDILRTRAALADYMWSEINEVFEQLTPLEMLQLIRP